MKYVPMYVSGCVGTVSVPNCFHSTLPESFTRELLLEAKMHTHSIVSTILHLSTEFETSYVELILKKSAFRQHLIYLSDNVDNFHIKREKK